LMPMFRASLVCGRHVPGAPLGFLGPLSPMRRR
jgi:hypothetical protein